MSASVGPDGSSRWRAQVRLVGAALVVAVLLAQPAMVLGVQSAVVFVRNLDPIGSEPSTDYCATAGVVDTARNKGQVFAFTNGGGAHDCIGATNTLPAGWMGIELQGLMNGGTCGWSNTSFTSVATSGWTYWVTICPNPAGLQQFVTRSWINIYKGDAYTGLNGGPFSPVASY